MTSHVWRYLAFACMITVLFMMLVQADKANDLARTVLQDIDNHSQQSMESRRSFARAERLQCELLLSNRRLLLLIKPSLKAIPSHSDVRCKAP